MKYVQVVSIVRLVFNKIIRAELVNQGLLGKQHHIILSQIRKV